MNRFPTVYCVSILALVLLMVAAAPVLADEMQGNIAMIEHDDHTFTLVDDDNNIMRGRFLVGGQVLINDGESTFWDLEAGTRVAVTYEMEDGVMQATAIRTVRDN
jgi:hypothetical protein